MLQSEPVFDYSLLYLPNRVTPDDVFFLYIYSLSVTLRVSIIRTADLNITT